LEQVAAQQARAAAQQAAADEQAVTDRNTCINNLRQIDAAKNQWAENGKTADAVPTAQDIAPYIKLDANGNIPGWTAALIRLARLARRLARFPDMSCRDIRVTAIFILGFRNFSRRLRAP
jgi:hypothetical protein